MGVEQRRCDGGAVAAGAVDPHLAVGNFLEPAGEFVQRHVERPVDVGGCVLLGATYVEDDHGLVLVHLGEVGERGGRERRQIAGGPGGGVAGGMGCGAVDADAAHLALRLGDVVCRLTEQRDGSAPRDEPPEVGGEVVVDAKVVRARGVPGSEGRALAQVHDPLAVLDAAAKLGRVSLRRRAQVSAVRSSRVRGSHVHVVGGVGTQAGEELTNVRFLVLGQGRVRLLLLPDGGVGRI